MATAEELSNRDRDQKAAAKARQDAARQAMEAERAEADADKHAEIEKAQTELQTLMAGLKEPERREIRLHAAVHCLGRAFNYQRDRQIALDETATRLARYMVTGVA